MISWRENEFLFTPCPPPKEDFFSTRDYALEELLSHQELLPRLGPEIGIFFASEDD